MTEFLGKRVLVLEKSGYSGSRVSVEEFKILEVSPSGKWIKVQNIHGSKFWKSIVDVQPVEILEDKMPYSK